MKDPHWSMKLEPVVIAADVPPVWRVASITLPVEVRTYPAGNWATRYPKREAIGV